MKRHANIPIFIPHLGCPNQCVFCNQRSISGVNEFKIETVRETVEKALNTLDGKKEVEIAFFGGSFTGIDFSLMQELLKIAYSYIEKGLVSSVRCSTRPDYISEKILGELKKYGVKTVELGLQSTNDRVLLKSKRGHSFYDEEKACRMIIAHGFNLVGQMMIGLPDSTLEAELETARFIIASGANAARIYPTVVFNQTELCKLAKKGEYTPLTLEEAVSRSAEVMKLFIDSGVNVIRVGLCASENLSDESTCFAGPNHSALGELVENEIYLKIIRERLSEEPKIKNPIVFVPRGALSKAIGQKKRNKKILKEEFSLSDVIFAEKENLKDYEVEIMEGKI